MKVKVNVDLYSA